MRKKLDQTKQNPHEKLRNIIEKYDRPALTPTVFEVQITLEHLQNFNGSLDQGQENKTCK